MLLAKVCTMLRIHSELYTKSTVIYTTNKQIDITTFIRKRAKRLIKQEHPSRFSILKLI